MAKTHHAQHMALEEVICCLCGSRDYTATAWGKDYEYDTTDQTFSFVSCRKCGHEYLNPRPVPADLYKAYPAGYYTLEGRHTSRRSSIISRLKSFVIKHRLQIFEPIFKGSASILEVGCGDGSLLLDLRHRHPQLGLTGMDFSVSAETKDQFKKHGVELILCRVEDAILKPETFDLIIMNQLIEHVADPVAVMTALVRSLKPGGRISIETPNRSGYDRRFFSRSFWGGYYFPRHLHLFDKHGMNRLFAQCNLTQVHQGYLLAPIIWTFSIHGAFKTHGKGRFGRMATLFFTDRNPLCLTLFTLIDLLARFCGCPTSNQKFIAEK